MAVYRMNMFGNHNKSNKYLIFDEVALDATGHGTRVVQIDELQRLVDRGQYAVLPFITTNTDLSQVQAIVEKTPNMLLGFSSFRGRVCESTYTYYGLTNPKYYDFTVAECGASEEEEKVFKSYRISDKSSKLNNKDLPTPGDAISFITYSLFNKVYYILTTMFGKVLAESYYLHGRYVIEVSPDPQLQVVGNRYVDNSPMSAAFIDSRFYELKAGMDKMGRYVCELCHKGLSESGNVLEMNVARLCSNSPLGNNLVINMGVSNEVNVMSQAFLQKLVEYIKRR